MARNIIQDVVLPKHKKTNINAVGPKKEDSSQKLRKLPPIDEKRRHQEMPFPRPPKRAGDAWWKKSTLWWSVTGILAILGWVVFLSPPFIKVNVEIFPRKASFPVDLSLSATKNPAVGIPFEITLVKGTETRPVSATGTKQVERKASGQIVVYNNYSSAVQKLVSGTRFLASNGKIYRIASGVTVPGTSKKGNETIPGSVEVTVYADQTGPSFNVGLTDFTIPGFKGDPRYDKFFGRSKTEITGGFSGLAPVASEKDAAAAKIEVEKSLKDDLLREAGSQVPDGYILYKNAVQIKFEDVKDTGSDPQNVMLGENGTLVGVLLKKDALTAEIMKGLTASANASPDAIGPFTLDSLDSLSFSFGGKVGAIDSATKEISFSLSGSAPVTYTVPADTLKSALLSKPKKDFSNILASFPSVLEAKIVSWQPFWARSFPDKIEDISFTIAK